MNVFEFILIPVAIIIGLGIAELFSGVARISRGEMKAGALHSVWVAMVFLFQVQGLWSTWGMHNREVWSFPGFFLFLIAPVGLYLQAAILFPAVDTGKTLDEHLMERRRPFFLTLALTLAAFSISGWLVWGSGFSGGDVSRFAGIGAFIFLAVTKHRGIHWIGVFITLLAQLRFIYLFTLEVG